MVHSRMHKKKVLAELETENAHLIALLAVAFQKMDEFSETLQKTSNEVLERA